MIHVFYRNRNTIGQFMVALIFLGTFGFLFTSDGFVSKPQASGCCGGGETTATSFAADSSGDFGSDIPMDAESTGGCCGGQDKPIPSNSNSNDTGPCDCLFLPGSSEDRECGDCITDYACDGDLATCGTGCNTPCKECNYGLQCAGDLCSGNGCCTKKDS